jgi:large conductance mechanosensitive channel
MKKFGQEFKKFIMRGNVLDMAVGVIIATAFGAITTSLINNILMPVIGWLLGDIDLASWKLVLREAVKDAEGVETKPEVAIGFGVFIAAIINFILIALIVFLIVKGFNKAAERAKKKEEAKPAEPTTKVCPFCQSEISIKATRCPHCTSEQPKDEE